MPSLERLGLPCYKDPDRSTEEAFETPRLNYSGSHLATDRSVALARAPLRTAHHLAHQVLVRKLQIDLSPSPKTISLKRRVSSALLLCTAEGVAHRDWRGKTRPDHQTYLRETHDPPLELRPLPIVTIVLFPIHALVSPLFLAHTERSAEHAVAAGTAGVPFLQPTFVARAFRPGCQPLSVWRSDPMPL